LESLRVIDRLVRVLTDWENAIEGGQPSYDCVYVSPPDPGEVFSEAFSELAMYGDEQSLAPVDCRLGNDGQAVGTGADTILPATGYPSELIVNAEVEALFELVRTLQQVNLEQAIASESGDSIGEWQFCASSEIPELISGSESQNVRRVCGSTDNVEFLASEELESHFRSQRQREYIGVFRVQHRGVGNRAGHDGQPVETQSTGVDEVVAADDEIPILGPEQSEAQLARILAAVTPGLLANVPKLYRLVAQADFTGRILCKHRL
jgi:hypothetical protein